MAAGKTKTSPLTIGDTIKKTINKTLVIGVAFTAAVILAPATFARDHHDPRPSNGIQLAADIVNLVRAVIEPRPAPVIVEAPPAVVEKTVVVEAPPAVVEKTVVVTGTETVTIPEYSYVLYEDEYIPYYEGWLYYRDIWQWVGREPRPAAQPRWKPRPYDRHVPGHHKVIVLPEHHHAPAPVVVHHEAPRREPVIVHHEAPRREPVRTVVVRPDRKDTPHGGAPDHAAPKKGR